MKPEIYSHVTPSIRSDALDGLNLWLRIWNGELITRNSVYGLLVFPNINRYWKQIWSNILMLLESMGIMDMAVIVIHRNATKIDWLGSFFFFSPSNVHFMFLLHSINVRFVMCRCLMMFDAFYIVNIATGLRRLK